MDLNARRDPARSARVRAVDWNLRALCEEHVEELAILWRLRSRMVGSSEHRLVDLCRLDERLDAHADALAVMGESSAGPLAAGLASEDAAEMFASAYPILRGGIQSQLPALCTALGTSTDPAGAVEGLRDALVHAPGHSWVTVLEPHCRAPGRARAVACEVLAFRGMLEDALALLPSTLASLEDSMRTFGWRAVAHGLPVSVDDWMQGFDAPLPTLRSLALQAAGWHGAPFLVDHLRRTAQRSSPPDESALLVFAWLAGGTDVELVADAAGRLPSHWQQVRVLSALGHPSVIPRLIETLSDTDPRAAAASAQAVTRVTGWDLDSGRTISLPPEDAPLGDEIAAAFDEVFVLPDPDRARALWRVSHRRFEAGVRWSRGIECSAGLAAAGLREIDLESLKAFCLRARLRGKASWSAARLEAFPQPRLELII